MLSIEELLIVSPAVGASQLRNGPPNGGSSSVAESEAIFQRQRAAKRVFSTAPARQRLENKKRGVLAAKPTTCGLLPAPVGHCRGAVRNRLASRTELHAVPIIRIIMMHAL